MYPELSYTILIPVPEALHLLFPLLKESTGNSGPNSDSLRSVKPSLPPLGTLVPSSVLLLGFPIIFNWLSSLLLANLQGRRSHDSFLSQGSGSVE